MSLKNFLPRSWRFFIFGALVLLVAAVFPGPAQPEAPDTGNGGDYPPGGGTPTVSQPKEVRSTLWRSYIWESLPTENLDGPGPDPISQAYQKNDWRPIFIDSQFELNPGATLILDQLRELENQAIDPRPFKLNELSQSLEKLAQSRSALRRADPGVQDFKAESLSAGRQPEPGTPTGIKPAGYTAQRMDPAELLKKYDETFRAASETDIRLITAFFLFAREMNPFLQEEECLNASSGEIPIAKFVKELEPKTFNYDALVSAYGRYKTLAAQGNQQHVGIASKVRRGESGNHIRDLQKRLQQEGFYSANITGVYDTQTELAVKNFQAAHLIEQDGAVGRQTLQWLNVSFQTKAEMVAMALKAVRQSPSRASSRFIRINIPQFLLEYYKDGEFQQAHRIVVGKASGKKVKFRGRMVGENQTPTLTSAIEQVILNPRWYVSDRIRLELNAEAKSDPEWFTRHGYVTMQSQHPWGEARLFQSPGPKNALGRVKFEFPNPYAVYLHDTPLKHLFARTRRDFSHGCMRVDKAIELAERLLKDDANPYAEKMKTVLTGSNQVFVRLSQPVPISVEYIPVVTNGSAQVIFVGDPYGILAENNSQKG
jgi:peptidoglycan hydrolase-like protein with peptidoglycan-binding domain